MTSEVKIVNKLNRRFKACCLETMLNTLEMVWFHAFLPFFVYQCFQCGLEKKPEILRAALFGRVTLCVRGCEAPEAKLGGSGGMPPRIFFQNEA